MKIVILAVHPFSADQTSHCRLYIPAHPHSIPNHSIISVNYCWYFLNTYDICSNSCAGVCNPDSIETLLGSAFNLSGAKHGGAARMYNLQG